MSVCMLVAECLSATIWISVCHQLNLCLCVCYQLNVCLSVVCLSVYNSHLIMILLLYLCLVRGTPSACVSVCLYRQTAVCFMSIYLISICISHLIRGLQLHLPETLPQKLQALRVPLIFQRHWAENISLYIGWKYIHKIVLKIYLYKSGRQC